MKFSVTAVPINRVSRRRTGKARTEVIDTMTDRAFRNAMTPQEVESVYEAFWNEDAKEIVKVVDVRQLR